jgi:ribosomal protein L44E
MKILGFGEKGEYECYRVDEIDAARRAKVDSRKVMLGLRCTECGDYVFRESLQIQDVRCPDGFCGNRRGVHI